MSAKNLSKNLAFFFFIFIATISSFPATNSKTVVKIGYVPNFGTINEPFIIGKEGFGYEFFEEIAKYTNHKYEFIEIDSSRAWEMLENGTVDILRAVEGDSLKANEYTYSSEIFGFEEMLLVAPKVNDFYYENPSALDNTTIGVLSGTIYESYLKDYLQTNNITATLIPITPNINSIEMQKQGIEIKIMGSLSNGKGFQILDSFGRQDIHLIAKKEKSNIIQQIDYAIQEIEKQNPFFNEALYIKYLSDYETAKPYISPEEFSKIQSKNKYTVAFNGKNEPLSAIDSSGVPYGYGIDIMNEIARVANISLEFIPESEIKNNGTQCDFNINILGKQDIYKNYRTIPFQSISLMEIQRTDSQNKTLNTVGLFDYISLDKDIIEEIYPDSKIEYCSTTEDLYMLFTNKKIDAIILSTQAMDPLLMQLESERFAIKPLGIEIAISLFVSKNLPTSTYETVKKIVEGFDKDFISTIIEKSMASYGASKSTLTYLYENWHNILIVFLIVTLLILANIVLLINRKREDLQIQLSTDSLTGLQSRYSYVSDLSKISSRNTDSIGVAYIDLNDLKKTNDTMGHNYGDELIRITAKTLKSVYDNKVYRIGGDEFVILYNNISKDEFENKNKQLQNTLKQNNNIKMSIGTSWSSKPDEVISHIETAEKLMYANKKRFYINSNNNRRK